MITEILHERSYEVRRLEEKLKGLYSGLAQIQESAQDKTSRRDFRIAMKYLVIPLARLTISITSLNYKFAKFNDERDKKRYSAEENWDEIFRDR